MSDESKVVGWQRRRNIPDVGISEWGWCGKEEYDWTMKQPDRTIEVRELCLHADYADALAQIEALTKENKRLNDTWQPIESAPKDGKTEILLGWPKMVLAGYWSSFGGHVGWFTSRGIYAKDTAPTHWQPLPGAPT